MMSSVIAAFVDRGPQIHFSPVEILVRDEPDDEDEEEEDEDEEEDDDDENEEEDDGNQDGYSE